MRHQMSLLQQKLSNQTIITDQLIRKSMLSQMSFFKKYLWLSVFAWAYVIVAFYFLRAEMGMSIGLYIYTVILMTGTVAFDNYINRYSKSEFLTGNLVATSRRMVRARQLRKWSLAIGTALTIPWVAWLCYDIQHSDIGRSANSYFFLGGMCVGGIIGLVIGLLIFFKMQRINREIVHQIDNMLNT